MYIICKKNLFSYWTLYGDILYDVWKVLYKYCTSTFPISTLTIMFMYIMWWYIYEYHSCNCFVEINSIQFKFNSVIIILMKAHLGELRHGLIICYVCPMLAHYTSAIKINYDYVVSDHHLISGTININVITPYIDDGNNDVKQKIAWDKLPDSALEYYEQLTETGFDSIIIPDGANETFEVSI